MISPPSSTSTQALPGRHCAVEFQALPSRIGQVRRIVSAQLRYWRLDPLIDAAVLGVTELLTNVHRHAESDTHDKHCTVELALVWDRLTISVHDHDPRLPSVRSTVHEPVATPERMATSGRGLALVAAVSASWGMRAQRDGSGKTVWFSLPAAPAAPRAAPGPGADGWGRTTSTGAAAPEEREPPASLPVGDTSAGAPVLPRHAGGAGRAPRPAEVETAATG
ncbi:ATP-binding protein [Streptomyces sp. NBC_01186]|nr:MULTISPECIES: ATP-binding protein [unclassified Streptomyces]WSB74499.1 ATP-binding protein [Streptomyces sp. NBC_01775]WSS17116.1 ATP-binding protein [Streptomyces sp. NBC_01186]WSS45861.1 ATP-binding protein [Streptomyces sp. NBC_01187]